jgi:hypothetical protein
MTIKDVIAARLPSAAALGAGTITSRELPELASFQNGVLYVTVTAVSGTNPTLDVTVYDRAPSAAYGAGWLLIGTLPQILATGSYRVAIAGPFGTNVRLQFVVGGTATPTVTFSCEIVGTTEEPANVFDVYPRFDALTGSTILFREDFSAPSYGLYNDGTVVANNVGLGSVSRDWEVPYAGMPSLRLDCQGNTTPNSDPGRTATTAGIVFKRRLSQIVRGVSSVECFWRLTSNNAVGSNAFFSMSHYNRDGVNAHHGRIWLDTTNAGAYVLKYLASGGTWTACPTTNGISSTINLALVQHLYDLPNSNIDKAGGWMWWRLRVDFNANKYVDCTFNDMYFDLSSASLDDTASTGAQMLHFSVEYSQKTSTRRWMSIAQMVGRRWG